MYPSIYARYGWEGMYFMEKFEKSYPLEKGGDRCVKLKIKGTNADRSMQ